VLRCVSSSTTTVTILQPFFQVNLDHPVPPPHVLEENLWGLVEWCCYRLDVLLVNQPRTKGYTKH